MIHKTDISEIYFKIVTKYNKIIKSNSVSVYKDIIGKVLSYCLNKHIRFCQIY